VTDGGPYGYNPYARVRRVRGGRGRGKGRRYLPWILVLAAVAGGGYHALERPEDWSDARGRLIALLAPLVDPVLSATAGPPLRSLNALVSRDTTVAAGSAVELVVGASDPSGRPLTDVPVRFTIEAGGGTLLREESWTDPTGIARTSLLMPEGAAEVVVLASMVGTELPPARFTVRGGNDAALVMGYVQGDGQEAEAGTVLPDRFSVQVVDAANDPVPGVEVEFRVTSGGGFATPARALTDSLGRASTLWRLGPGPGFQTLAAASSSVAAPVTFTAIARPADDRRQALDPAGSLPADVAYDAGGLPDAGAEPPEGVPPPSPRALDVRPGPVSVIPSRFAVGGSTVCRLEDSSVTCRGADDRGQSITGGATGARAVAAGLFHTCALDAAGVASCWGANESGQLGDATRTDQDEPVEPATTLRFFSLAAGVAHTCGLASGGRAVCWGQNIGGQLGDGSREDRTTPAPVSTTASFNRLVAGWSHTCGVTGTGTAHCWGLNREGQIGDGSRLDRLEPREILGSVRAIAAGSAHTCAISQGRVLCWGENRAGQLGDGTNEGRVVPTPVESLPGLPTDVVAGAAHTCALMEGGAAYCWGQNLHGQLGNGSTASVRRPTRVSGGHVFQTLSAGGAVTCGTTMDGDEYCWGLNQSGQLGDGTRTNRSVPTRPGG